VVEIQEKLMERLNKLLNPKPKKRPYSDILLRQLDELQTDYERLQRERGRALAKIKRGGT
jgi:hypothetical protein